MANKYETVFIMTPVLSEDQTKETVKKFTDYLKKNGSKITNEENWGLKKLAYPIQKKSTGFYHLIEHESDGQLIQPLEVEYKRDERIIRFLTVKMDKHHAAFADKMKKKAKESA